MRFEILVEDDSGKIVLDEVMKKIKSLRNANSDLTHRIISYKGAGRIPKNLRSKGDPSKRILLEQLPKLLKGYGKSLQFTPHTVVVVVVVDLDNRNCKKFKKELTAVLEACDPSPNTLFRIAIEEIEAWLLGDKEAVKSAYPGACKRIDRVLKDYEQDSICGTWEKLVEAVEPKLNKNKPELLRFPLSGKLKCELAQKISPHLNIENNRSKSFQVFLDGILRSVKQ